ncbi:MAG: hypothetical protein J7L90_00030 [Dehalococcoidia bacterium]|nr:hypothetical protein [Dehalococcoidia bacterium]
MRNKRVRQTILILLLIVLLPTLEGSAAYRTPCFRGICRPYSFGIVNWSAGKLIDKGICEITNCDDCSDLSEEEQAELIRKYLYMGTEKGYLNFKLMEAADTYWGDRNSNKSKSLTSQEQTIDSEMEKNEKYVETIIRHHLQALLEEEGICLLPGHTFPPVALEFEELPYLAIISPRDRIELLDTMVLSPTLTLEEISEIESRLEDLGFSALIERVGGFSTYPSMIPQTSSPQFALSTIAHEWTHHYLFFHSLGRHYNSSYDMRIINETVCDTVGEEMGARLMDIFYGEGREKDTGISAGDFDLYEELHSLRLAVDEYLQRGELEKAELAMEEKRQFIYQNGYYIRKINQAYFAFHGSYGSSPSSTSPIGTQIKELRERSSSLGEFLKLVDGISNPEDFQKLLDSR